MLYSLLLVLLPAASAFTGASAFSAPAFRRVSTISAAAVPELYVYDHCPFCVRVRLALGVKGIKHKLVFMGNDDVETPTALVGKKIAPIWVDEDGPMAESLDIIEKMDTEGMCPETTSSQRGCRSPY